MRFLTFFCRTRSPAPQAFWSCPPRLSTFHIRIVMLTIYSDANVPGCQYYVHRCKGGFCNPNSSPDLLISLSLLASDLNRLPRYTNDCTCPSTFPWTDTLQAGLNFAFENTIVKDFVLFRYSPFSSLSVTTVLINCCSCCSDSAKITVMVRIIQP